MLAFQLELTSTAWHGDSIGCGGRHSRQMGNFPSFFDRCHGQLKQLFNSMNLTVLFRNGRPDSVPYLGLSWPVNMYCKSLMYCMSFISLSLSRTFSVANLLFFLLLFSSWLTSAWSWSLPSDYSCVWPALPLLVYSPCIGMCRVVYGLNS